MADASPPVTDFPFVLVVKHEFNNHRVGDVIDDPSEISEIMNTHHESFVVKRAK